MTIRRQSQGFSRGSSSYRGVTFHPSGVLYDVCAHSMPAHPSTAFRTHNKVKPEPGILPWHLLPLQRHLPPLCCLPCFMLMHRALTADYWPRRAPWLRKSQPAARVSRPHLHLASDSCVQAAGRRALASQAASTSTWAWMSRRRRAASLEHVLAQWLLAATLPPSPTACSEPLKGL